MDRLIQTREDTNFLHRWRGAHLRAGLTQEETTERRGNPQSFVSEL